jgi:GNAT superfamily N-acetyltransferase
VAPVRRVATEDVHLVATTLARAFAVDPVARYIFPAPSTRQAMLERFFTLQLRHNYLPRGEVYASEHVEGAALWMPPRAPLPRLSDRVAHLLFAPRLGDRFGATRRLTRLLESRHPVVPHFYLGTIGTDPAHQGKGVGSALVGHLLAFADAEHLPVYLECSLAANVAFYARFGFAVSEELLVEPRGPRLWLMWREAR